MSEEKEVKFVRFKDWNEDIVGIVTFHDEYITIERPLVVEVDTDFEEGRQMLTVREYLPQAIVAIQEMEFDNHRVLLTTPVRKEFKEQYDQMAEFFYERQPNLMNKKELEKKKRIDDEVDGEKIISLIEALRDKKNKPVH